MALTAEDQEEPVEDNWDDSKHTVLENAVVHLLKFMLSRTMMSQVEYNEVVNTFPVLWGNEAKEGP